MKMKERKRLSDKKKKGGNTDEGRYNFSYRYMISGWVFAAVLVVFLCRALWLGGSSPILPGLVGAGEIVKEVTVPAIRGEIYDRNGVLLVGNSYKYSLKCSGVQYLYSETGVEELYLLLCDYGCDGKFYSYEALGSFLESGKTVTLCDDIPMSMIAYIKNERPPGLSVEKTCERTFYDDGCASHILGHTGKIQESAVEYYSELGYPMDATVGVDGAEAAFEQYLHGTDGKMRVTYDSLGNTLSTEIITEPSAGSDIYLTIDIDLQRTAAESLNSTAEETGTDGGAIIPSDETGGEVIVCASYPSYTAEQYKNEYKLLQEDMSSPLFNRAVSGRYAPGSVMKLSTAVAALEEGVIKSEDTITDLGKYDYYEDKGYSPVCWLYGKNGGTHGAVNIRQAIMHSCNYFFFEAGRLTGIDAMNEWSLKLGLGELSGIELSEASPVLAGPADRLKRGSYWGEGETLAAAIGQSDNLFTPTQLCSFISVIANGGTKYAEHLLLSVYSQTGEAVFEYEPEVLKSTEISESTLNTVRGGMYDAAHTGTIGAVFSGKSYEIGGKTGTAQISGDNSNALFAAYAPFNSPEISVVCVLENGTDGFNAAYPSEAFLTAYFEGQANAGRQNSAGIPVQG